MGVFCYFCNKSEKLLKLVSFCAIWRDGYIYVFDSSRDDKRHRTTAALEVKALRWIDHYGDQQTFDFCFST